MKCNDNADEGNEDGGFINFDPHTAMRIANSIKKQEKDANKSSEG